jgi:hypothetical protein
MYNDNNTPSCQLLLNWLRVALVRQADGQPSCLARPALTAFIEQRLVTLQRDLPSLTGGPGLVGGGLAVATHLGELVADLRQNRINDEAQRALDSARTPE